jgi:hypothetical protein
MQGADVCAVPIALHHHDNLSENQQPEPIMFTAIFSDSANGATCSRFSQDLVGPVLHFHRCANPHKMIECANLCLIQSLAWYQVLFCHSTATSSMNQRDPSKCFWLNGDLKSSCVLVNHGYHDIHTKIMDHDVLDFFLKKRSVSACQG